MKLKIDLSEITDYYKDQYPAIEDSFVEQFCRGCLLKNLEERLPTHKVFDRPYHDSWQYDARKYDSSIYPAFIDMANDITRGLFPIIKSLLDIHGLLFTKFDKYRIDDNLYEIEFHPIHNVKYTQSLNFDITTKYLEIMDMIYSKNYFPPITKFGATDFWYLISKILTDEFRKRVPLYSENENLLLLETREAKYDINLVNLIKEKIVKGTNILESLSKGGEFASSDCVRFIPVVEGVNDITSAYIHCIACKLVDEPIYNQDEEFEYHLKRNT